MKREGAEGIGEPAGIDSFYTLEYYHGGRRYRSPFFIKIFSGEGRKVYEDALCDRYLSLLDHLAFGQDVLPVYRDLFLREVEDLVDELRGIGVSARHLKGFLETKGSPGDSLFNRVLSAIERPRWCRDWKVKRKEYFPSLFLFKVVGGMALVVAAGYFNLRFVMLP